jgi:hypothetical protein
MRYFKTSFFALMLCLFALVTFGGSMAFIEPYSDFAAKLLKAGMALTLFSLYDRYALKEVDTIDEIIHRQNIAYSLHLLAVAVIIAAAINSL